MDNEDAIFAWKRLDALLRAPMSGASAAKSSEARAKEIIEKFPQLALHADSEGNTALMAAATGASLGMVKLLMSLGNSRASNREGLTALMVAVQNGNLGLAKELLPQSDPWAVANNGWMPLAWALAAILRCGKSAGAHRMALILLEGMEREPLPGKGSQALKGWEICWQMSIHGNCSEIIAQAGRARSVAEAAELSDMAPRCGLRSPFKASL